MFAQSRPKKLSVDALAHELMQFMVEKKATADQVHKATQLLQAAIEHKFSINEDKLANKTLEEINILIVASIDIINLLKLDNNKIPPDLLDLLFENKIHTSAYVACLRLTRLFKGKLVLEDLNDLVNHYKLGTLTAEPDSDPDPDSDSEIDHRRTAKLSISPAHIVIKICNYLRRTPYLEFNSETLWLDELARITATYGDAFIWVGKIFSAHGKAFVWSCSADEAEDSLNFLIKIFCMCLAQANWEQIKNIINDLIEEDGFLLAVEKMKIFIELKFISFENKTDEEIFHLINKAHRVDMARIQALNRCIQDFNKRYQKEIDDKIMYPVHTFERPPLFYMSNLMIEFGSMRLTAEDYRIILFHIKPQDRLRFPSINWRGSGLHAPGVSFAGLMKKYIVPAYFANRSYLNSSTVLAGLHPRAGAKSSLMAASRSTLFDRQVLRCVLRAAGQRFDREMFKKELFHYQPK